MIGSSKNNRENYLRKCFWTQEKETLVKFNPGLSDNRPLNNWAWSMSISVTVSLDILFVKVLKVTNINFLLTISVHYQKKRLGDLIKWSPQGKCFNSLHSFFKENRNLLRSVKRNCRWLSGLKGLIWFPIHSVSLGASCKNLNSRSSQSPCLEIVPGFRFSN